MNDEATRVDAPKGKPRDDGRPLSLLINKTDDKCFNSFRAGVTF